MEDFLKSVEKKAFRMIQIAVGDTEDALDLLQDSMMKFVSSYDNKPETEWRHLFYKVVQNKIRDFYRRRRIKAMAFSIIPGFMKGEHGNFADPIQTVPDKTSTDSFTRVKTSQAMEKLESVLQTLPSRQHKVFLLRAWEGLSVKETAKAMTCSQGTVKTHYSRAVTKIKDQLEGVWP